MKLRTFLLIFGLVALSTTNFAQSRNGVEKTETVQRTLQLPGTGTPTLELDNVQGAVHVVGYDGKSVEVTATKTIRGRTANDISQAEQEVTIEMNASGNTAYVYVNGPFRGRQVGRTFLAWLFNPSQRRDYEVHVDFEVRVPWVTKLLLKTVNDGDVVVENTTGDFELTNVNGDVEIKQIVGSGEATTVNGSIRATFAGNPRADSAFTTINGGIAVTFKPQLAAELHFSTINGDFQTDFGQTPTTTNSSRRRFIQRSRVIQAGSGGPEINFTTINGNIRVSTAS